MNINIKELKFKIKLITDGKRADLLAYCSLSFVDEHERYFTCNGFTVRKSKFDGNPYVTPPSKSMGRGFYKFVLTESSLWKEIEKEIIKQYEYESIPVIEETGNGGYKIKTKDGQLVDPKDYYSKTK